MAVTVTPNLTNITLGLDESDWTNTDGTDYEIFIQGTGSESWYVPKGSDPTGTFDAYGNNGNTTYDMSPVDTHLYFWATSTVALLVQTQANGGFRVIIESDTAQGASTSGTKYWNVGGSDTWDGRWTNFIVDVSSAGDGSTGTIDLANIGSISFYVNSIGTTYRNSAGNYWIDAIRFGTGLVAIGTDFNFADIATNDALIANKYGILEEVDGVYFVQGKLEIGDGTNITQLNSINETIVFRDRNVSSGIYELIFTGSNTSITADTFSILSSGINENTRPDFIVDPTVTNFEMDGCSINRGDFIVFNDDCDVQNSVFNNCNTVSMALSIFKGNTVSNSNHIRAFEIDQEISGTTNFAGNNFLNNFSAATWYAFGGIYSDTDNNYDGNLYDVENSSSNALTINLAGSSNVSSKYENPGTIDIVSTTNYTLTNLAYDTGPPTAATEVRIYLSGSTSDYISAGDEIYGVENITNGTTTFQYGQDIISSGHNCVVMIHNINYETIRYTVDLLGVETTQQIQQRFDRNYKNP